MEETLLKELLVSIRPKQWYKNIVIFAGVVFSFNLFSFHLWLNIISAFAIFCMLSGSEYIINDVLDREKDKHHPVKQKRPIASGRLKVGYALLFAILLLFIGLLGAYLINIRFFLIALSFFSLVLFYSVFLKRFILVDVLVISVDFVIRAIAGCLAIKVIISPWLIICTFLLALLLALGKRQHECILVGEESKNHRRILENYSSEMLDQMINITVASLIMAYSLYTFLADNYYLMFTIPFAFYGLFRYLFLIHAKKLGGQPELLFKDKGMLLSMGMWTVLIMLILYNFPDKIISFLGV